MARRACERPKTIAPMMKASPTSTSALKRVIHVVVMRWSFARLSSLVKRVWSRLNMASRSLRRL